MECTENTVVPKLPRGLRPLYKPTKYSSKKINIVKPALRGHFGTMKRWSYMAGDLLNEVQFI